MVQWDHGAVAGMRRVFPKALPPKPEDEAEVAALQEQCEELVAEMESGDTDDAVRRLSEVQGRLDELTGAEVFAPEDIARGGALVQGRAAVERVG